MKTYSLYRTQFLPVTIDVAWDFFSTPNNLAKITPPDMGVEILTKMNDDPIFEGMQIAYKVRPMFRIPLFWETVIGRVNKPYFFTDMQKKGPYALWEHTHTFMVVQGGVNMTDEVKYALPLGVLGTIAHALFVRKRLKDIFDFRAVTLEKHFGKKVQAN